MLRYTLRTLAKAKAKPITKSKTSAPYLDVEPTMQTHPPSDTSLTTSSTDSLLSEVQNLSDLSPASKISPYNPPTRVSKLKNGLTVVTRESLDNTDFIGFYFRAGTPYIRPSEAGYPALLSIMLTHTNKMYSTPAMIKAFAANQSTFTARVTPDRNLIAITAEGLPEDLAYLFEAFTSALFLPAFQHWELSDSLKFHREYAAVRMLKEDPTEHVLDLLHSAAFEGSVLGLPVLPDTAVQAPDIGRIVSLWQRTCVHRNLAVVGSTTWLHDTVIETLAQNEDILRNESEDEAPGPTDSGVWRGGPPD